MSALIDLTGRRFGRLVVLSRNPNKVAGQIKWDCRCDCGVEKPVTGMHLRTGAAVSCGCHRVELMASRYRTHGEGWNRTPEYQCWANIQFRCSENADAADFRNYYLRGIRVCEAWQRSYEAFLSDMGRRPGPEYSIDRIDNDGGYEPGNCRWAKLEIQSVNKRTTCLVDYHGERLAFKRAWEKSERVVSYGTAHSRYWRSSWPAEAAIDTPRIVVDGRRKAGSSYWTTASRSA